MCGILGYLSTQTIDTKCLERLMHQSKIRGKHATGISYINKDKLISKIIPKDATYMQFANVKTKMLIGHTRYSTSSLKYNQPIGDDNVSIVHNGVITQQHSRYWNNTIYKFKTSNDSEFILKSYLEQQHPLISYPNASIASIIIDKKTKAIHFFRNEKRPLYYYKSKEILVITSTKDILKRSGFSDENCIYKCAPCVSYKAKSDLSLELKLMRKEKKDLQ